MRLRKPLPGLVWVVGLSFYFTPLHSAIGQPEFRFQPELMNTVTINGTDDENTSSVYFLRLQQTLERISTRLVSVVPAVSMDESPRVQIQFKGAIYAGSGRPNDWLMLSRTTPLPLPCAEEARIAHRLIHFDQQAEGAVEATLVALEWKRPKELLASEGEVAYGRQYCRPDEMNLEQKTLARVQSSHDEKKFQDFLEARTPCPWVFPQLAWLKFDSPESTLRKFSVFVAIAESLGKKGIVALKYPSLDRQIEAYRGIQALNQEGPRLVYDAMEQYGRMLRNIGHSPEEVKEVRNFGVLRERYNVAVTQIRAAETQLWQAIEKAM